MKGSAADIIVKYLEQEGVEYLFGVPGGHLLPLYDAIYRSGSIKPVLTKHESGAAFMACGYALTSGKIGVCCGTVGPGATNMVTGVAAAYVDSIPILALTAQVGTTAIGKGALQEGAGIGRTISQVGLFDKATKLSIMEVRGRNLPGTLRGALRVAQTERPGPVHIDLPADVQGEVINDEVLPPEAYRPVTRPTPSREQVQSIARHLLSAKKAAILAGAGAAGTGQDGSLLKLAERLQIPVATTLRGKGVFPEDHPLALGCVGLYGSRPANSYLRSDVDVLLALGTSFHEFTTHCWDEAFRPTRALIHVDVDATEIGKNYPVTVGVVADAAQVVQAVLTELGEADRVADPGNPDIAKLKQDSEYLAEASMRSDSLPIKPQRLMAELRSALPRETLFFGDIGNTVTWAERYLPTYPEGRLLVLSGLAAMGSGTAACIGAQLGRPAGRTVCICGDGDFLMHGMEVATAADYGIPVIWLVMKDERLGMVYDIQTVSYQGRHIAADLGPTDFVSLARALGASGYRANTPDEVRAVIGDVLQQSGPAVIEVPIDSQELPPMKPRMLAVRRSVGLPDPAKSFSWGAVKALWSMRKER